MKAIHHGSMARNFLSGILLLGILVSFLGGGNPPTARAQEAATPTPEGTDEGTPEPKEVGKAEPIPSQVIIKFKDNTSKKDKESAVISQGGKIVEIIDALNVMVVQLPSGKGVGNTRSPVFEDVEQDYYIETLDEVIPDDPRYPEQWALPAIGAPQAWAQLPEDATKVTIAVNKMQDSFYGNQFSLKCKILYGIIQ